MGAYTAGLGCLVAAIGLGCSSSDTGAGGGADAASYDGASSTDAAMPNDATTPDDSAAPTDSTAPPDATTPDGGSPPDGGSTADSSAQDAGTPAIRYIGRFDTSKPSQPVAEWSGSAMEARFSGSSVSARLGGSGNYFAVVLDGVSLPTLNTDGGSSYAIASGLDAGTHEVLVFRRDEAFDQPTQFIGFAFGAGGQLLPPPGAPPRRIEIIGDSISAGFGDECTNASQGFTAATENEYIAYGPLTARALGADVHVVAWSGKGMYRNLDGTTTETIPILWQRTIPTDPASSWDPSTWIADAVVINLGTNDYNATGPDPSSNYEASYLQFVTHLRTVYPGAFLFCAVGPMLGGAHYASVKTAIQNVISTRSASGDGRLQLVEFPTQNCGADGSGCGCAGHPNAAEHQAMATILEGAMHSALGW
jgi:lysophospholipase L1-like esterase